MLGCCQFDSNLLFLVISIAILDLQKAGRGVFMGSHVHTLMRPSDKERAGRGQRETGVPA